MNEHTAYQPKGQVSRYPSDVLAELCYRFVRSLLQELHTKMDRRLVHTFLDLLPVIVMHRHRNHGLLLSELGGYLLGAEHAPAGDAENQHSILHGLIESIVAEPLRDFGVLELTTGPRPILGADFAVVSALKLTAFGHEMLSHLGEQDPSPR